MWNQLREGELLHLRQLQSNPLRDPAMAPRQRSATRANPGAGRAPRNPARGSLTGPSASWRSQKAAILLEFSTMEIRFDFASSQIRARGVAVCSRDVLERICCLRKRRQLRPLKWPAWAQPGSPTHSRSSSRRLSPPEPHFDTSIGIFDGQSDIGGALEPAAPLTTQPTASTPHNSGGL